MNSWHGSCYVYTLLVYDSSCFYLYVIDISLGYNAYSKTVLDIACGCCTLDNKSRQYSQSEKDLNKVLTGSE